MTLHDFYVSGRLDPLIAKVNATRGTLITRQNLLLQLILSEPSLQEIVWSGDVWDFVTTEEYIENLLMTCEFDFASTLVEYDTDIPRTSQILRKALVKSGGVIWVLHKSDADPFPSKPHAHNFEHGLKLDLSDGGLYRKRERTDSISYKQLLEIRRLFELRGFEMPVLAPK